ncbi:MAG: response regulator [Candidatus Methylomirabilia bacterium]
MENPRILVIDDEPKTLEVMVDLLEQAGYAPQSTSDSREAARVLESSAFDVIVCDIVMPHLSGLQVLEVAKRANPAVHVVMITAYATREFAQEALNKGASAFIEKPFHAEPFLATIRQAIWRHQLKDEPRDSA